MKREVEKEVKKGNYASTSEFIRAVLREWKEFRLLKELKASQREIKDGKGKVLESFDEWLKD